MSLSLSHWYPGSGVVLDCIDSWSLHPYLLSNNASSQRNNQIKLTHFDETKKRTHDLKRLWANQSTILYVILGLPYS